MVLALETQVEFLHLAFGIKVQRQAANTEIVPRPRDIN